MGQTVRIQEDVRMPAEEVAWSDDAPLELALVELRAANDQLQRALASRAVIDQAIGMVMILAPCSSATARSLLVDVSQHSNVKLREVATALVATADGEKLPEPLRKELRRARGLLHAENRR
ncbi:ANTAR domain-containing protein [Streptomyces aureocirculatus]|uniref:ANTAR domain-containing protein n=1 Tax=Streptomyces aureocirculatus TaxID=67275 RepID=UPI001CED1B3D|nr:ANTAR domain-containing protein [Streptomyces aureocirculatus]